MVREFRSDGSSRWWLTHKNRMDVERLTLTASDSNDKLLRCHAATTIEDGDGHWLAFVSGLVHVPSDQTRRYADGHPKGRVGQFVGQ